MTENEAREMLKRHFHYLKENWKPYPDEKVLYALGIAISSIEKLQQYKAIGTVDECRQAREKQIPKKPVKDEYNHDCCPICGWGGGCLPHCENCGQAIDCSE